MTARRVPLVLALAALASCSHPQTIYRSAETEAAILNEHGARLATWPVPWESRYVGTSYGLAHVVAFGPAEAPPLVLLHAMGVGSIMWRANAASLAAKRRVYALDTIGDLGRSRLYDLEDYPEDGAASAAWIAEVLDELGVARADVIGASYGGWLGLQLALHQPQRVGRLALLGPMGLAPVTAAAVARLMSVALFPTDAKKREMVDWALGDNPVARQEFEHFMLVAMDARGRLAIPRELTDEQLKAVRAPVLLMLGDTDGPVGAPAIPAARARAALPRVEVEILPATGHLMNVERPEAVNARLQRFLDLG